ncbi:MAG: hypothetical protein KDJ98_08230 [Rhodobacteraceae bacterium]|nr:hypothetical protein [Paracoccaceae bacterium]
MPVKPCLGYPSRTSAAVGLAALGFAPLQVHLSPAGFQQLRAEAEAEARGSRSDYLARRLIEAALADNLIDAILDDGGDA